MDGTAYDACRLSINPAPQGRHRQRRTADVEGRGEGLSRKLLLLLALTLLCHMATALDTPAHPISDNRHICSKKSDFNIFYNVSLCERHRVVERDAEEGGVRQRRGRDRTTDREVKKIKVQDEEDDDDVDIDPDQLPERALPPAPPPPQPQPALGSCGLCRPREQLRKHSLEVIKGEILSKLGMTQPPNLTGRFRPEFGLSYLLEKYESDTRGSRSQYQLRRHAHQHSQHQGHHTGLRWVTPDDDTLLMQGDAPADR